MLVVVAAIVSSKLDVDVNTLNVLPVVVAVAIGSEVVSLVLAAAVTVVLADVIVELPRAVDEVAGIVDVLVFVVLVAGLPTAIKPPPASLAPCALVLSLVPAAISLAWNDKVCLVVEEVVDSAAVAKDDWLNEFAALDTSGECKDSWNVRPAYLPTVFPSLATALRLTKIDSTSWNAKTTAGPAGADQPATLFESEAADILVPLGQRTDVKPETATAPAAEIAGEGSSTSNMER